MSKILGAAKRIEEGRVPQNESADVLKADGVVLEDDDFSDDV